MSTEFTKTVRGASLLERIFIRSMGVLLKIEGNCSCLKAKVAHMVGHLPPGSLTRITSANAICGSSEQSSDATQVFSSPGTPVEPDNCRGYALQGPSTLSTLPAAGGTARTIYSSQSHAIAALHPVSSQTLLMYIENTGGDFSQNGLWKINTDGSGLTRLTTAAGQRCADREYAVEWPQIISNGQSYALRTYETANESLMVGSLNGGGPTSFETRSIIEGIVNMVG